MISSVSLLKGIGFLGDRSRVAQMEEYLREYTETRCDSLDLAMFLFGFPYKPGFRSISLLESKFENVDSISYVPKVGDMILTRAIFKRNAFDVHGCHIVDAVYDDGFKAREVFDICRNTSEQLLEEEFSGINDFRLKISGKVNTSYSQNLSIDPFRLILNKKSQIGISSFRNYVFANDN